eukprot:6195762-Pleurochrysis_carterae.AAC.2
MQGVKSRRAVVPVIEKAWTLKPANTMMPGWRMYMQYNLWPNQRREKLCQRQREKKAMTAEATKRQERARA